MEKSVHLSAGLSADIIVRVFHKSLTVAVPGPRDGEKTGTGRRDLLVSMSSR